jgi:hypothetical protein
MLATSLAATQTVILPAIVDRVIACRWNSTLLLQYEQPITVINLDPTLFDADADPISFSTIAPSGLLVTPAGGKIAIMSTSAAAGYNVSVRGIYSGSEVYETMTAAGAAAVTSTNNYDEVLHISKDSDTVDMIVKNEALSATLLTLPASETHRFHQRLHFHATPTQTSTDALILYKRRCNDLVTDSDSTEIVGIDAGIEALAEADMLEGQRQYAKASAKREEAGYLIQAVSDMELHQSANMVRIIPDTYGQEWESECPSFME